MIVDKKMIEQVIQAVKRLTHHPEESRRLLVCSHPKAEILVERRRTEEDDTLLIRFWVGDDDKPSDRYQIPFHLLFKEPVITLEKVTIFVQQFEIPHNRSLSPAERVVHGGSYTGRNGNHAGGGFGDR
ncbi:MAG: hypothetical protein WC553_01075 [Patescibacteria group bacterium]